MRKYLTFSGRTGRLNYVLAAWIFPSIAFFLVRYLDSRPVQALILAPFLYVSAAFTARRLHDLNFSALWLLSSCASAIFFSFTPFFLEFFPLWLILIGASMSALGNLFLVVYPGTPGSNRYGNPPEKVEALPLHDE